MAMVRIMIGFMVRFTVMLLAPVWDLQSDSELCTIPRKACTLNEQAGRLERSTCLEWCAVAARGLPGEEGRARQGRMSRGVG